MSEGRRSLFCSVKADGTKGMANFLTHNYVQETPLVTTSLRAALTAPRSERLLHRKGPMRITNLKSSRPLPRPAPQRAETDDRRQPESRPQEPAVDKFEAVLLEAR